MEISPLSKNFVADVVRADITTLSDENFERIYQAWLQFGVLRLRNQPLDEEALQSFSRRFGPLEEAPMGRMSAEAKAKIKNRYVTQLSNIIENGRPIGGLGNSEANWHSDMTYDPTPPKLTMLYALEAPAIGGETAFANQILAYQELSAGMKKLVGSLVATHSAKDLARLYGQDPDQASEAEHPVVRTHDESGEKALYVCRAFTRQFQDWSRQESKVLLDYLYEHSVRPEYQARHQWQAGDLVMWDNRCLLHYAVHDHGEDPRLIHRLQVQGTSPV